MPVEGYVPSNSLPNQTHATPRVDSVKLDADDMIMSRDILRAIDPTFEEDDFITFLETESQVAKASKFYNYEQGRLFREALIASVSSATTTGAVITLASSAYTTVGELSGTVDRSPIKEGDLIPFAGDVWARVNAKSGSGTSTTYTLRRVGTTGDLGAIVATHITNAWPIIGQSNAFGEGTGFPTEGLDTPATRFVGQFQTIKSYMKITGDAASHEMFANFNGKTYYWDKMTVEQLKRHRIYQNMTLMFGPGGTVSDGVQNVTLSGSLRSNLQAHGNQLFYNKSTGVTLANLDKLAAAIKGQGYTKALIFSGSNVRISIENLLRTFTTNGGIVYSTGSQNGQRSIDLGFGEFTYHGVTFRLQEYRIHEQLMGQVYMPYADEAYIMPDGKMSITTQDDINGARTLSVPSLKVRYKVQSNGMDRRFKVVTRTIDQTMVDEIEKGLMSQEGLQQVGIRKGFFLTPASA
jgi:hypothetical protein